MTTLLVRAPADPSLHSVRAAAPNARVVEVSELTAAALAAQSVAPDEVTGAVGFSPHDEFTLLPRLAWVHSKAAGVDAWLRAGTLRTGINLTSAVGNGAIPLAEHALMLMLMLSRDAPRWARAQTERCWDRFEHGELAGAVLGIIGYGNSGRDLARKALACNMQVQALKRSPTRDPELDVKIHVGTAGLESLLRSSDVVVITAPLTPETRDLIGEKELSWMKSTAHLILVSRGGIVDEAALRRGLSVGTIAGAAIDAFVDEPLPENSPWWDVPRAILTPHNGATTAATLERGRQILLDNVARWSAGWPLLNVVDRDAGY